jgi:hypothetical protein
MLIARYLPVPGLNTFWYTMQRLLLVAMRTSHPCSGDGGGGGGGILFDAASGAQLQEQLMMMHYLSQLQAAAAADDDASLFTAWSHHGQLEISASLNIDSCMSRKSAEQLAEVRLLGACHLEHTGVLCQGGTQGFRVL